MAPRRAAQRRRPLRKQHPETLNFSSAPQNEREWIVFRAGVHEGVDKALAYLREKGDEFKTRALCSGVELSTPSAVQTSAAHPDWTQTSAAVVKAFQPQLKRRRTS